MCDCARTKSLELLELEPPALLGSMTARDARGALRPKDMDILSGDKSRRILSSSSRAQEHLRVEAWGD